MARIDPGFDGNFMMAFNPDEAYTHKSQYLLNARLLGDKSSNLIGNDHDNILMGNAGNNVLDGALGFDVVQYPFAANDAAIAKVNGAYEVTSDLGGRDLLRNIELLRFTDQDVSLTQ